MFLDPTPLNDVFMRAAAGPKCCSASHVPPVLLQALLLHGSLPEDEQDVSLSVDQGSAEQQLVEILSLFFIFSLSSLFSVPPLSFSLSPSSLSLAPVSHFAVFHRLFVLSTDHISPPLSLCVCERR